MGLHHENRCTKTPSLPSGLWPAAGFARPRWSSAQRLGPPQREGKTLARLPRKTWSLLYTRIECACAVLSSCCFGKEDLSIDLALLRGFHERSTQPNPALCDVEGSVPQGSRRGAHPRKRYIESLVEQGDDAATRLCLCQLRQGSTGAGPDGLCWSRKAA